jgi:hypothetical protein
MAAMMAARHMPTASAMPGTTLGVIPIPAFGPRAKQLFDTAGVLIHHRVNALLDEDELKEVRAFTSLPASLLATAALHCNGRRPGHFSYSPRSSS